MAELWSADGTQQRNVVLHPGLQPPPITPKEEGQGDISSRPTTKGDPMPEGESSGYQGYPGNFQHNRRFTNISKGDLGLMIA